MLQLTLVNMRALQSQMGSPVNPLGGLGQQESNTGLASKGPSGTSSNGLKP